MTTETTSNSARSEPKDWAGIGTYLENKDAKLLAADKRQQLLKTWRDVTQQEETLDDAILIGLVGGTGVGKSTFINGYVGERIQLGSEAN